MLNFVNGDATKPNSKPCVIAHICNNKGLWGKGFVQSITKTFGETPRNTYRKLFTDSLYYLKLGHVQYVTTNDPDILIANMIGQDGVVNFKGNPPIRYEAVEIALNTVMSMHKNIHMPRIGTGLAGGDWESIEQIIKKLLEQHTDCNITVYDYV